MGKDPPAAEALPLAVLSLGLVVQGFFLFGYHVGRKTHHLAAVAKFTVVLGNELDKVLQDNARPMDVIFSKEREKSS